MGRGKEFKAKRQNHEHEKPKTAKRFAESGDQVRKIPEGTSYKE
ncbi:hypothetical protein GCM10007216_17910 [Thalassobacillus devorans]|uniref:Competence protein n=1 Tax=Thalassobacillus devorans TaxID=279813 RepID=A0ABQ1P023_9BACI|nr:hypothetical protein [Thalassobacillus devorans]NIK28265.1 hypothetical protein [Thalassobacillus devorans]GGC87598.1 hypothetical protein GCM10007216_17910 [Thalassobacillus devorans]